MYGSINAIYEGRKLSLNAFKSEIFPLKPIQGKIIKLLTSKEILQRLPIAFVQIKASNTSENLSNKIRQIIYSLH